MRKSHNDYIHNAHMQHERTMHVCKMHTFYTFILHVFFISVKKKNLVLRIFCTYAQFFVFCTYTNCHSYICANYVQNIPNNMCKM